MPARTAVVGEHCTTVGQIRERLRACMFPRVRAAGPAHPYTKDGVAAGMKNHFVGHVEVRRACVWREALKQAQRWPWPHVETPTACSIKGPTLLLRTPFASGPAPAMKRDPRYRRSCVQLTPRPALLRQPCARSDQISGLGVCGAAGWSHMRRRRVRSPSRHLPPLPLHRSFEHRCRRALVCVAAWLRAGRAHAPAAL